MRLRSYLYAPGNRPERFTKALGSGADAIVLDLEDSVPPEQKAAAQDAVRSFLVGAGRAIPEIFVRVNGDGTWRSDLNAVVHPSLSGVRIAKAEDPALVAAVHECLGMLEQQRGIAPEAIEVVPMIESLRGLDAVRALAAASSRVRRFIFGAGDFVHDIRAQATPGREGTFLARSMLVLESRRLGLEPPVAHVYSDVSDLEGLARMSREDRAMGFFGRSCIHPSQVPVVNTAFTHGAAEIARAQAIVETYSRARSKGLGATRLDDGTFVDEAVVKRADRVLAEAAGTGLTSGQAGLRESPP